MRLLGPRPCRRSRAVAFFIGLFLGCVATTFALPRAGANSHARNLGKAYRLFEDGEFARALQTGQRVPRSRLRNADYLGYLVAQSAYFTGDYRLAHKEFEALAKDGGSRFQSLARWRVADCLWQMGDHKGAGVQYEQLIAKGVGEGEAATGRYRLAILARETDRKDLAIRRFREFLREHPEHSLVPAVDGELVALGDGGLAKMAPADRIQRAIDLIAAKKWEIAVDELALLEDSELDAETRLQRDFWLSMALFKRRRYYDRAGETLLSIYKKMGPRADEALFHGARALSRADFDKKAIHWYQKLVAEYPQSRWAPEAQFLSGWLEFNMGNYKDALPYLAAMRKKYPRSRFAERAAWYQGMSHFLLGEYDKAIPYLALVGKMGGKEVGAQGDYWRARALVELGKKDEAFAIYRSIVGRFPFSWYALLSRARLAEQKIAIGPFGDSPRSPGGVPELAGKPDPGLLKDELILRADELMEAGLDVEAGRELYRGERSFLKRHRKKKSAALGVLMHSYRKAGDFNRPWMLAVVHGGPRALDVEPKGKARIWWEHAYPLAYREWVDKYRKLGGSPDYYLYTIMLKESGFAPHTHSFADAQGLLQMIPPTTIRVAPHLDIEYTEDLLFDPEKNIMVGSWYIGRLLDKFKKQIPIGAGSYNGGPRAVMKWLEKNGARPIDVFVELVSYDETRLYMKRTTEIYARYKYLYDGAIYEQPLSLDADFVVNDVDY